MSDILYSVLFFFFFFFFSLMIYAMYAKGRAVSNLMLSEELAHEYKTRQNKTRYQAEPPGT